jgi:uncharacterized membrane protein
MYKIIGADGHEYGPVTVEQVHQWIREGRANAQTRVQPEGSTEWKALGELSEFSASFSGGGAPPPGAPASAEALAAEISARSQEIDIASCISRGWNLVKNNFWRLMGTSLLIFLLIGGVGGALRGIVNLAMGVSWQLQTPPHNAWDVLRLQWPGILVNTLWNLLVSGALIGGLYNYYLKLMRGQPATLGDAFAGFSTALIPLTLAHVVTGLLSSIGTLCCLLPGIYLGVAWKFTLPLVIDKRLGVGEAMELSRKTVTRQWWSVFALLLLAGLLSISGVIACCIGIFVTVPIGIASILYAYEDIFGSQPPAQNT